MRPDWRSDYYTYVPSLSRVVSIPNDPGRQRGGVLMMLVWCSDDGGGHSDDDTDGAFHGGNGHGDGNIDGWCTHTRTVDHHAYASDGLTSSGTLRILHNQSACGLYVYGCMRCTYGCMSAKMYGCMSVYVYKYVDGCVDVWVCGFVGV